MPHFLINSDNINSSYISITEPETLKHLLSAMRVKVGEKLKFIDENEMQYTTNITDISKKELRATILKSRKSPRKLDIDIYLAISVLKQDAQNLAIANATQLGARGIYPVITEYSTLSESVAHSKTQKWQKVAYESFKQCERADIPTMFETSTMDKVFNNFKKENIIIFTEKDHSTSLCEALKKADKKEKMLVVIGPEGGFSEAEYKKFADEKYTTATLGNLILKAPNAVSVGIFNVIYEYERQNNE